MRGNMANELADHSDAVRGGDMASAGQRGPPGRVGGGARLAPRAARVEAPPRAGRVAGGVAGPRLDAGRVASRLGARGSAPPAGFDRDVPELPLNPLPPSEAGRLLDQQPRPPRGRARRQVLAQAAGNPMALIELARVIAADPSAGRRWDAEPLPLTDRLPAVLAHPFRTLPGPARAALLLPPVAAGPGPTPAPGGP